MIVSNKDFFVASNHNGTTQCMFKADQYHVMAWRTPGNYAIGVDMFADNGHTSYVGCDEHTTKLEGKLGTLG